MKVRRLLAICVLGVLQPVLSVAVTDPDAEALSQLEALFSADELRADYIMVVDTSRSMRRFWSGVRSAIVDFVDAVPDGDHLSVVLFDWHASSTSVLPREINPRTRAALRAEFERLPIPDGRATDFGFALEKIQDEIRRPGGNRLVFLFIFSDFEHFPPRASPYQHSATDPAWRSLAESMKLAKGGKVLQTFGLLLPLGENVGRDLPLVRGVIGPIHEVVVSGETLGPWFKRRRQEIRRDKLQALVADDLDRGLRWEWSANDDANTLTVASGHRRLPVAIGIDELTIEGLDARIDGPSRFVLPPGEEVGMKVRVSGRQPENPVTWLLTTRSETAMPVTLGITGLARYEPADEFSRLLLSTEHPVAITLTGNALVLQPGAPIWLQVGAAVLLALAAACFWATWLRPVPGVNAFVGKVVIRGGGIYETVAIPPKSGRRVQVGNVPGSDLAVSFSVPAFGLILETMRPRFPFLRPRRGLYGRSAPGGLVYSTSKRFDRSSRRQQTVDLPLGTDRSQAVSVLLSTRLILKAGGDQVEILFRR